MDLKEVGQIDPARHWYYQHKLRAVMSVLRRHAVPRDELKDVGAGSAFFAQAIGRNLGFGKVTCIDQGYSDDQLGVSEDLELRRSSDGRSASAYLLMDVLEHVDDDVLLLAEYVREAQLGATFIVTVPAFDSLWSSHDEYLEHRRRYSLTALIDVCVRSGLCVVEARYLFAPTFPVVWAVRRLRRGQAVARSDLRQPSGWVNTILRFVLGLELLIPMNRMFGSTALVVAVK